MNPRLMMLLAVGGVALGVFVALRSPRDNEKQRSSSDQMTGAEHLATRAGTPPAPLTQPNSNVNAPTQDPTGLLCDRWLNGQDEDQREALEADLLALGEGAAPTVIARLDSAAASPAMRDRLFNLLRRLPGAAVEARMIEEAVRGKQNSTRTMAFESLGQLKTPAAAAALTVVALSDPDVPAKPLIAEPRNPNDPSTELPDEQVFTPRMKAMTALANSGTPKAVAVLSDIARTGPDESLRLEAARNLGLLRENPQAMDTLRVAAASDPSAYVRLSALHALQGAKDPTLAPVLERIASNDVDLGVRTLAAQVAAGMRN